MKFTTNTKMKNTKNKNIYNNIIGSIVKAMKKRHNTTEEQHF
jgi:hypothetical protein